MSLNPTQTTPPSHANTAGWWRWWLILSAMSVFFWLSLEDTSSLWVAVLGANLTTAIGALRARQSVFNPSKVMHWLVFGIVIGASATFMITFLMFFKTAWHSHASPDFPLPMMLAMLARTPIWMLAGGFIGLALYALRRALITRDSAK